MKREDILDKSRVSLRCLPKSKLFVEQLLEIASAIAPVMLRAKECIDQLEYLTSDHNQIIAQTQMLNFANKIQQTLKAVEEVYEKQPKGVKTIFNRDCMMELFLSMLQEYVNVGGEYV